MDSASSTPPQTVIAAEAAHFGRLAEDWWNPKGSSAMLHRLNPARLGYIRAGIDAHWDGDDRSFAPLAGKRALDVGCGAGLLAEPLARLGAAVTGVDAAPENVRGGAGARGGIGARDRLSRRRHRGGGGRALRPRRQPRGDRACRRPGGVRRRAGGGAGAGGLMVLSTPNRTPLSRLAMIAVGEGAGLIPRGTHDWSRFLTPDELTALLEGAGLAVTDVRGLGFSPARGFVLSGSTALDYFVTARHRD